MKKKLSFSFLRTHRKLLAGAACLLAGALLEEPNVELYDFQAVFDWTEDYDLYYDLIHYIACVNDAMAFAMAEGTCRVTDMAQIGQNNAALTARVQALFAQ